MFQFQLAVILGPTASGKSDCAVECAKALGDAVILGCDSRQIYKDLTIGTGKVEGVWVESPGYGKIFEYRGVPHFLIDYVSPLEEYSVSRYAQDFTSIVDYLSTLERPPRWIILTGGTGYYAQSVLEGINFSTKHDGKLDEKPLYLLKGGYISRALTTGRTLNTSDRNNPRRLAVYLSGQTVTSTGLDPRLNLQGVFALKTNANLRERIAARITERVRAGMIDEYNALITVYPNIADFGLEYKAMDLLSKGLLTEDQFYSRLTTQTWQYARRQITWIKHMPGVKWVTASEEILAGLKTA